ncbi:MAG: ArsB/NhaD family transporter [Planctomycetota bacterium]
MPPFLSAAPLPPGGFLSSPEAQWTAGLILALVYAVIAFEVWHRTLAALVGGSLLLAVSAIGGYFDPGLRILDFDIAMRAIDWNVIFLLLGMMIVVGVLKETGVFQWCAYKAFALSGGSVFRLAALLMVLTAVASANLDNVTTMLLIAPVSIEVARVLKLNPLSLLIPEVLASNVGGTATLIGDPPNIMIGSHAGLTYADFLVNLAPCVALIMVVHLFQMKWVYRKDYAARMAPAQIEELIGRLRKEYGITNRTLLVWSGAVLAGVTLLFLLHGVFHMKVAVPALLGAGILLIVRDRIEDKRRNVANEGPAPTEKAHGILHVLEKEVEWPTLVFFMFLFIVVEGAKQTGLIHEVAVWVKDLSAGNLTAAILLVLFVSAIASAIIDNIPFTATMLPLMDVLVEGFGPEGRILWWALALGACLGGNATIIGASANVVTAGIAEKAGARLTFFGFLKVGLPAMIVEVAIAAIWLLFVDPWLMGRG